MSRTFFQPAALNEALKYRRDYEGAAILAGGTDLVVAMHKDKFPERDIVDLSKIEDLKEIKASGDEIIIGPMATFTALSESEIINEKVNLLVQAAKLIGAPQIRNKGTIGGNICNASPAADMVSALVCLKAKFELKSMGHNENINTRLMAVEDFIKGSGKISLEKNEILTNIIFKIPQDGARMGFMKIGRRNALAISRLNGACILKMDGNIVSCISLVLGSATSKPERFRTVEDYLRGRELTHETLKDAGRLASDYVLAQSGRRSSSAYKLPVVSRFTAALIEKTFVGGEEE